MHVCVLEAECERGPEEGCVGPILTAPLCLHFHTLLSHYKRRAAKRTDSEDTGLSGEESSLREIWRGRNIRELNLQMH